jgi:hypothetical protein
MYTNMMYIRTCILVISRAPCPPLTKKTPSPWRQIRVAVAVAPSMISLADRRVTDIPVELESKLCLEPYCCPALCGYSVNWMPSTQLCLSQKMIH